MTIVPRIGLALSILAMACSGGAGSGGSTGDWARAAIRPEAIRAHMAFLADDLLEGRGNGQRGYTIAARYVAAQLASLGVEPGGEAGAGGFEQPVRLREARLAERGATVAVSRQGRETRLVSGRDFAASAELEREEAKLAAPVVFAGFGITAPEFQHDDYAGVDVRGKVVALFGGAPASFPANPRAHYSGTKAANAAARGAVGMVILLRPDEERAASWAVRDRSARRPAMTWLDDSGGAPDVPAGLLRGIWLASEVGRGLFEGSPLSWDAALAAAAQGKAQAAPLSAVLRIEKWSRHRELTVPNVIGRIPGSDPTRATEHVVYTAHLDHDGVGAPVDGDSIYNGAYDNAAGIAALIEVARAFATRPRRPARSILLVATAAEERGLLGATYFAAKPTVPLQSIVANLNMDGNLMVFRPRNIVAMGAEHSSLGDVARDAAAQVGFGLVTELMPEQAFFIRSDQYPFVKKGIPALFFTIGTESADSGVDGMAVLTRWLGSIYHTPKDDMDQPMDLEAGAQYARVAYLVGNAVAEAPDRPAWRPGDFFGEKFGKPAAQR
jgi:hypothetical protein